MASASPEREESEEVCASTIAVMSLERWTLITLTFRHRLFISDSKASIRKRSDVAISSRGLLSWLRRNSPVISAAVRMAPRVSI